MTLILGRLRPSKRLTSTVRSQCAVLRGGTVQPNNFSELQWAGAFVVFETDNEYNNM